MRFLVLSAARTGSTMLIRLLQSHPDIRCEGEILGARNGNEPPLPDERLAALREDDPTRFLAEWVYRDPVAGFKIKYEELMRRDFERIRDWLASERSIKVVHLFRRNRLKRLVSETAVRFDGTYGLTDPVRAPEAPRFTLSVEQCLADFAKQERREARFSRLFADHDVLEVLYEDLPLSAIQRFLGVEPRTLHTPTLKINPDRISDVLLNYEELREAFRDTPYADYFDHDSVAS
jgi:LPS sulfotransferase NodH